ncbi:MAG: 50S ribosomal protein L10, partial [Bacteroidetes bacterium]
MERAKKEEVVAQLREKLARASTTLLTDFKGLKVSEIT